jgi:hypothetical protein
VTQRRACGCRCAHSAACVRSVTPNSLWVGGLNGVYRMSLTGTVSPYQTEPAQVVGLTATGPRAADGTPTLHGSIDTSGGLVPGTGSVFRLDP